MNWIRRNWPDVLIGVALLAVIAGIAATLISGGSFLPFARNTSAVISTSPSTTSTSLPSTVTDPASSLVQDATNVTSDAAATLNQAGTAIADAVAVAIDNVADTTETIVQPVIPDLPSMVSETPQASVQVENSSTASEVSASTAAPVSAAASATSPFRVSVGAFGNIDNAQRRAATFRDAGYPVFLGTQGNLSIVLIGPYDSEFEAEQVRSQIRSSGLEPNATVYRYEAEAAPAPSQAVAASPSTTVTEVAAPAASTGTSGSSAPPTASSGRYLQVGAYNSIAGSMPQRTRLESIGYTVVHIEEQGLIKLLVGPFDPGNLSIAQSQLNSQGIESFVR